MRQRRGWGKASKAAKRKTTGKAHKAASVPSHLSLNAASKNMLLVYILVSTSISYTMLFQKVSDIPCFCASLSALRAFLGLQFSGFLFPYSGVDFWSLRCSACPQLPGLHSGSWTLGRAQHVPDGGKGKGLRKRERGGKTYSSTQRAAAAVVARSDLLETPGSCSGDFGGLPTTLEILRTT